MTVSSGSRAPYTLDLPLSDLGDDVQSIQIPVYEPSSLPPRTQPDVGNVVTESQRRELERLGYRLNRERQVISVPLGDGSSILVPVDSYGLKYGMQ
jgi:hypothetical protein